MNIKNELLREHSKPQADKIAAYIGHDVERFKELIELLLDSEYRVSQRAAMVLSHSVDRHRELLTPHIERLVKNLRNTVHIAVVRNTVRLLQFVDIPENLIGETADICFKLMESSDTPIAVKVFSMTVLANICEKEPDLKNELALLIEDQMPYGSAGFRNRGAKILKKISY
ncbi:MAG: hypothetical protein AAGA02_02955 [Bacteroidota bacterium]